MNLSTTYLPSNKRICKTRNKTMRTILSSTHYRSAIPVLTTEKDLLVRDIVNGRVKKKSTRYAISQIVGQVTIQYPKSRSLKRGLVTNT